MGKHLLGILLCVAAMCVPTAKAAVERPDSITAATAAAHHDEAAIPNVRLMTTGISESVAAEPDTVKKKQNIIQRLLTYFKNSNKPKYKKFDFSLLGGPYYNSDTKLGIALMLSGFYRRDTTDRVTSPSNVSLYGTVSTSGFYMTGIKGHHIFPKDTRRIDYDVYFWSNPRYFWGIGYDNGLNMDNRSKYDEIYVHCWANYITRVYKGLFIGPGVEYKYAHAGHMERPYLWEGQKFHTSTIGVGFKIQYDTRDNFTATEKGILASVEQKFCPKFIGNKYAFSSTDLRFNYYHPLWKGSVIATQARAMFSYGNVPWAMLPTFGGSYNMRGYYEGRFRDKCEADITVELRQHVWRRNGIVIWGGVGSVFPKISSFNVRHLLPSYGIGYRWELKHRSNVRVDLGFGRGESAFVFSINEAF